MLTWKIVEVLRPYIVQISTPRYFGTGFIIRRSTDGKTVAVATAAHLVYSADEWEELIRIDQPSSGTSQIVRPRNRALRSRPDLDTAVMTFDNSEIEAPLGELEWTPEGQHLVVGSEMGWLGFPALSRGNLCFFRGSVSARLEDRDAYLVDGVVIHGVSGGPTFTLHEDVPRVIGVVSAYHPNRETGEALPGLGQVSGVTQFQEFMKTIDALPVPDKIEEPEPPESQDTDPPSPAPPTS